MKLKTFRIAFPYTIPVLTGFFVLGVAYGLLMQAKGYGPLWTFLMSAFAFCGSMQFAAITLLTAAFDPIQAFLLSLMVNARHLFYGLTMLDKYAGLGKRKFFVIYWMCDETFSITSSVDVPEGVEPGDFYFAISILDYIYWVVSSTLGSLLGGMLRFDTRGMDFALTALFVTLFMNQTEKRENRLPGLAGLLTALAVRVFLGAENLVIPSMLAILVILLAGRRKLCS